MLRAILSVFIAISLFSCSDSSNTQDNGCGDATLKCSFPADSGNISNRLSQMRKDITGKWKWIKTHYDDKQGKADTTYEAVYMNIDRVLCFSASNQLIIFYKDQVECAMCYRLVQQMNRDDFPVQLELNSISSQHCERQLDPGFVKLEGDSLIVTGGDARYDRRWVFRKVHGS